MTKPGERPPTDQLKDFERRLDKTLSERRGMAGADTQEGSAAGLAARVLTELFVAVAVCMGLGWFADKYFGTTPWIMLILTPLGLAAGVVNVVRIGNSREAKDVIGGRGPTPPPARDDDDED